MALIISGGGPSLTVEDVLTSTSAVNALSANQGRELDEKIDALGTVEHSAADITARDALVDLIVGDRVFVSDASSEADVDQGWAIYRPTAVDVSGSGTAWQKVAEEEAISDPTIVVPFSSAYDLIGVSNVLTEVPAIGTLNPPNTAPASGVLSWIFYNTAGGSRTVTLPVGITHADSFGNAITSVQIPEDRSAVYTVHITSASTWTWVADTKDLLSAQASNTVQAALIQSVDGTSIATRLERSPDNKSIIRVTDDISTVTAILNAFPSGNVAIVSVQGYNGNTELTTTTGTDTIPRGTYIASVSGGTQLVLSRLTDEVQNNLAVVEAANLDGVFTTDVVFGLTGLEFLSQYDSNRLMFRNTNSDTTVADMVAANADLTTINLVDETNTTTALTTPADDAIAIAAGTYLLSLNSAGNTLTLQTLSTPSDKTDLTQTLETFSTANGAGHAVSQEYVDGKAYTRLEGTSATGEALFQTEVSFASDREVLLRVRKDAAATVASSLRVEDSNGDYAEFIFNVTDGTNGLDDANANGVFPLPELAKSIETNDHYEWAVRFPAPTGGVAPYTLSLIPDFGVVSTVVGIGSPAVVGAIDVESLELDTFVSVSDVTATKINSSAAPTNESLPAASGSGEVRFWVNEDVTNEATLSVATGDSLNGVTDGTFTFSVYSAGTQFVATDTSAGEWVIAVQGASTDGNSPTSLIDLNDITSADSTLIQTTAAPGDGNVGLYNDGSATITRIGSLGYITLRTTVDDDFSTLTLGSTLVPAGGKIISASVNGFHRWQNDNMTVLTTSADTITIDRTNTINSDVQLDLFIVTDGWPELNPQVLAGMVTPEDVRDTIFSADGISVNTTGTTLTLDNGLTWADVAATYDTLLVANASSGGAQHVHSVIDVSLLDLDSGQTYLPAINAIGGGGNFAAALTSIDSADGDFTYQHFFTATVDFRIYGYKKQKTVVMPDALVPESLSRIQVSLTTTTNNSGATHYAFDETNFSQGSDLSLSGTGSIQGLQAGKTYKLTWQGSTDSTSNGTTVFRFVDLTTDATIGEAGWELISSGQNVPESNQGSSSAFFTPTVNTEVGVDFIGGTVGEMSGNSIFTVEQLPSSTVLVESDIPLEDVEVTLIDIEGVDNTLYAFSTGETWAQVKANYSYLRITGNASESGTPSIRPYSFIYDLGSGTAAETEAGYIPVFDDNQNGSTIFIDAPTDTDTGFTFQQSGSDTPTNGRMQFKVVGVKAQKSVVMPDVVPVEDVREIVFDTTTATDGSTFNWGSYADVAAMQAAGFDRIEVMINVMHNNAAIVSDNYSSFMSLASVVPDMRPIIATDSAGNGVSMDINPSDTNGGIISLFGAEYSTQQAEVKIWAVKPQKTVINTVDTPVDDQSASGYVDIGTTRIQWGLFNGAGADNDQTVTLPVPFANTNYSVVANSATAGQEWAVGTRATSTSSFTLNRNDSGSGVTDYHWQAIGVKP